VKCHKHNRFQWSDTTLEFVDMGACHCEKCTEKTRIAELQAKALADLPEVKIAKEKVQEFESNFGPVELGEHLFTKFDTESGETQLRSQKARGVNRAKKIVEYEGPYWLKVAKITAVLPQQGSAEVLESIAYPIFARPCPVRPRHGFVESRVVKNPGQALAVLCETLRADPQGEMMLMPPLSGKASAIATDSGVVWGKGNDGVTAGKGDQFLLPVPALPHTLTEDVRRKDYVLKGDLKGSVYVEAVEDKGKVFLVQMRDGPKDVPVGGNYVPSAGYEVTNVIYHNHNVDPEPNLLKWEKTIMDAPVGTVIWLPGGSLTSHLAVHGLARKLAVVTVGPQPCVGDVLQPSDTQPKPLKKADFEAMAKYVKRRISGAKKSRAAFAVSTLHALSAWGNEPHLLNMRIAGATMMARLLVSACIGEARHFYTCGPGHYSEIAKPALPWKKLIGKSLLSAANSCQEVERSVVLEKAYRYSIKTLRVMAAQARKDFRGQWGNGEGDDQGPTGFGGKKWADSAKIALDLCDAIIAFERTPTEKRWSKLLLAYNMGVAAAHNGGRLLDKWATHDEIDCCATVPQYGLLSPQAMFVATGVKTHMGDHLEKGDVKLTGGGPAKKKKGKKLSVTFPKLPLPTFKEIMKADKAYESILGVDPAPAAEFPYIVTGCVKPVGGEWTTV